jgi:hypothetical protein
MSKKVTVTDDVIVKRGHDYYFTESFIKFADP